MDPTKTAHAITPTAVRALLAAYPTHLPASLKALDAARYTTIPTSVSTRTPRHLIHTELTTLVDWKLKHGKFRPQLAAYAASNPAASVRDTTTAAFAALPSDDNSSSTDAVVAALDKVTALKGVGPATASLLLSVADPVCVPFFADELFRWVVHVDAQSDKGWEAKIGYTKKEYRNLYDRVVELRRRLDEEKEDGGEGITAMDLEKAAYVIYRESKVSGEGEKGLKRRLDQNKTKPSKAKNEKDAQEIHDELKPRKRRQLGTNKG